jgi:hypothetical protein
MVMRRTHSALRIAVAVAATALTAAAAIMLAATRRPTCDVRSEAPRQLRLDTPADQAHLDEDVRRIVRTAAAYRQYVARQPQQSESRDAVTNHAQRPARAYEYCKTIQEDDVATAHGIGSAAVKARVEAISAAQESARRD